jgi:hypothetical protein
MKKLAFVIALGTATLFGGAAVNAAGNPVKSDGAVHAKVTADANQSADMSSRHRHGRRHWRHRHWHHGWQPYYRSYGYYAPRYYTPPPVISFGFGPRFRHRHHYHW